MQNEAERERLFNQVNPISRSDIDLEGANVSRDVGLGDKWVIERLLADFILLEYIDVNNGQYVDEDGFVIVKKESKQWRKAVVRAISPWSAEHFQLQYGDTVLYSAKHVVRNVYEIVAAAATDTANYTAEELEIIKAQLARYDEILAG